MRRNNLIHLFPHPILESPEVAEVAGDLLGLERVIPRLADSPMGPKNIAGQHPPEVQEIETYLKTARTDSEEYPI